MMTCIPAVFEHVEQEAPVTLDDFHIWRSKFVEKHASAERQVVRLIRAANSTWSAKPLLSQKIDDLRKLLSQPGCTVRVTKVEKLLQKLEPHSKFRSALVHSTMTIAMVEGSQVAVLWPVEESRSADGRRIILTLNQLTQNWRDLSQVTNALTQEANEAEKATRPTEKIEI